MKETDLLNPCVQPTVSRIHFPAEVDLEIYASNPIVDLKPPYLPSTYPRPILSKPPVSEESERGKVVKNIEAVRLIQKALATRIPRDENMVTRARGIREDIRRAFQILDSEGADLEEVMVVVALLNALEIKA